ncbi:MAG TPA: LysE family transporter [Usitatibacteraceae bacterium]|nr:LysE family transporter [Usitatibacteraceae bacterium]
MDFPVWITYLAATIILSVSPGPGVFSSLAAGLNHGFRRGMWNAVGMQVANFALLAFVSVGLGAILLASESLFTTVKWGGVAYLVWLGFVTWRSEPHHFDSRADAPQGKDSREVFLKGFLVNLTNPKGIIFYVAVLPQFIDLARPQFVQYAILGVTTLVVDLVVMAGYIAVAARVLAVMEDPSHLRWVNRILGGAFVAAGVALAAFRRGHAAAS